MTLKNAKLVALLCMQLMAIKVKGALLPQPLISVVSSSDGEYLLRFDNDMRVFSATENGKGYSLISEFASLGSWSVQKALISRGSRWIVTFETPRSKIKDGLEEVICVYSIEGSRLKKWQLNEVLEKEDRARLSQANEGSIWWYHEVSLSDKPPEALITGPDDGVTIDSEKYIYALNLETLMWRKIHRPGSKGLTETEENRTDQPKHGTVQRAKE